MTPHTYAPGDLVKIISMEEVRKYPVINGWLDIGGPAWVPDMDKFAGTIQEIKEVLSIYGYYKLTNDPDAHSFSPEMISGPAEPPNEYTETVKAIRKKTDEVIAAGPEACKEYLKKLGLEPAEKYQNPFYDERQEYSDRLKEFVQIVMAANRTGFNSASAVIESAKNLLAAFDEEVKKYKI